MKNLIKICFALILVGGLLLSGCGRVETDDSIGKEVKVRCPDCRGFENGAVVGNCILTIYQEDGSSFLTNQSHIFCLCNDTLIVNTTIYGQQTSFMLSQNQILEPIKGKSVIERSPLGVFDAEICSLINELVLGDSQLLQISQNPVNIYGQWYRGGGKTNSGHKYYVNLDTKKPDLIVSDNYIARGYDYRDYKPFDFLVPKKIEILEVGKNKSPGRKLMMVEYQGFVFDE